jgi:hypothetical protein
MDIEQVLGLKPHDLQGSPEVLEYIGRLEYAYHSLRELTTEMREQLIRNSQDYSTSQAQARDTHMKDIEYIGQALIDQANDRGWCDMYDDFIREINDELHYSLPVRNRDYLVTLDMNVSIEIVVNAGDEDQAKELAEGQLDVRQFFNYSSFGLGSYHIHGVNVEAQ